MTINLNLAIFCGLVLSLQATLVTQMDLSLLGRGLALPGMLKIPGEITHAQAMGHFGSTGTVRAAVNLALHDVPHCPSVTAFG